RRIGEIRAAVGGNERQMVLFQQRTDSALGLHGLDLVAKKLDTVEAERGDIPYGCVHILRIEHRIDGRRSDGRSPEWNPGEPSVADMRGELLGAPRGRAQQGSRQDGKLAARN